MAERKAAKKSKAAASPPPPAPEQAEAPDNDESERSLGRLVSIGLPVGVVGGALAVGMVAGVGSAILVVAAGALLGTISLLWASVRTLSGDAPLTLELEALSARRLGVDALAEQKRRVLRALKDLESEHALGKIDDADYGTFVARYRDEAKVVMRKMDLEVEPLRKQAERLAQDYLKGKGLAVAESAEAPAPSKEVEPTEAPASERRECPSCAVSNEADATFCKKCGARLTSEAVSVDAEA